MAMVVMPTRAGKVSELLRKHSLQVVSHTCMQAPFIDLVHAVQSRLAGHDPWATRVWIDIFAICPHEGPGKVGRSCAVWVTWHPIVVWMDACIVSWYGCMHCHAKPWL